jgi:hypothetical protein
MASVAKAIFYYGIGKRKLENTVAFLRKVREQVFEVTEIITDSFPTYP